MALLSTLEPSADDAETPRGLLRLGGRSIVQHQLDAAMELGCEKAICLADGLPGELIALQHEAERGGAQFQIAGDGLAVARAVKPEDELLVFADGLVAAPDTISAVLGTRTGMVVQPVEAGVAAGYERLDLNHAGGGILRLPGRLAANLAELPGEWNPVSALLRIGAQSQVRQAVLPAALPAEGGWVLVRSDAEAHRLEPQWLRRHTDRVDKGSPGRWLVARLVEHLGPALLHARTRPVTIVGGAAALAMLALLLAWFKLFAAAFALLGVAWLVRHAGELLARVHGGGRARSWLDPEMIARLTGDGICIAIAAMAFAATSEERDAVAIGAFVAVVLVGLLWLIETLFAARPWSAWASDRLVLNLALAVASLTAVFDLALRGAVLGVLAVALAAARGISGPANGSDSGAESASERLTRS